MKRFALLAITLLLVLFTRTPASATDVSVLFTPISQTAAPGDTVNFSAIFTNNTATDLWISNGTITSSDVDFISSNSFPLFNGDGNLPNNGAFKLAGNQTLTVNDVLTLFLDPNLPEKTYALEGSFTGRDFADVGNDAVQDRELGSGALGLVVTSAPIPEPAFYQMSLLLVLGGMGWRRMRKR